MLRNLIAFPVLILVVILQSSIVSRITLLDGYADLMLVVLAAWALHAEANSSWLWAIVGALLVSFVSGLPWFVIFIGYLVVVFLASVLQKRVWQVPILAMFSIVFSGTLLMNIIAFIALRFSGYPLPLGNSIGFVILPSLLLNMFFSLPVFIVMRDMAQWVYPSQEVE